MPRRRPPSREAGRIAIAIGRHPREFVGLILAALMTLAIFVNALFLQRGPHPAPIFASRHLIAPPPKATDRPPVAAAAGTPAGVSTHDDPIARLLAPAPQVLAVQRALAEFGYGQIKPTGIVGPETKAAIEKFERDRHQPVTGEISDRLIRELSAVTGRRLE